MFTKPEWGPARHDEALTDFWDGLLATLDPRDVDGARPDDN
jgi:hypothetical protein